MKAMVLCVCSIAPTGTRAAKSTMTVVHPPLINTVLCVVNTVHAQFEHLGVLGSAKLKTALELEPRRAEMAAPASGTKDARKAARVCAAVGCTADSIMGKMMTCARCQNAHYCGVECQKKHWKVHKKACVKKGAAAAAHGDGKTDAGGTGTGTTSGGEAAACAEAGCRSSTPLAKFAKSWGKVRFVLPPASPRFPRTAPRVRVLVPGGSAPRQGRTEAAQGDRGHKERGANVDKVAAETGWRVYRGEQGARAFREEGFMDGDVVLLWPGTFRASVWGLCLITCPGAPSATVEIIGAGRRGSAVITGERGGLTAMAGLCVGGAQMQRGDKLAVRVANVAFSVADVDGAVSVKGMSNRLFIELDSCDILCGGGQKLMKAAGLYNSGVDASAGVRVSRGVSRIVDCKIVGATSSAIELDWHHTDASSTLDPTTKGQRVLIHGIKGRAGLNGQYGTSQGPAPSANGRCLVKLDGAGRGGGETVSLKLGNIKPRCSPEGGHGAVRSHPGALPWPTRHEIEHCELRDNGGGSRHQTNGLAPAIRLTHDAAASLRFNSVHHNDGVAVARATPRADDMEERDFAILAAMQGEAMAAHTRAMLDDQRTHVDGAVALDGNAFFNNGGAEGPNLQVLSAGPHPDAAERQGQIDAEDERVAAELYGERQDAVDPVQMQQQLMWAGVAQEFLAELESKHRQFQLMGGGMDLLAAGKLAADRKNELQNEAQVMAFPLARFVAGEDHATMPEAVLRLIRQTDAEYVAHAKDDLWPSDGEGNDDGEGAGAGAGAGVVGSMLGGIATGLFSGLFGGGGGGETVAEPQPPPTRDAPGSHEGVQATPTVAFADLSNDAIAERLVASLHRTCGKLVQTERMPTMAEPDKWERFSNKSRGAGMKAALAFAPQWAGMDSSNTFGVAMVGALMEMVANHKDESSAADFAQTAEDFINENPDQREHVMSVFNDLVAAHAGQAVE